MALYFQHVGYMVQLAVRIKVTQQGQLGRMQAGIDKIENAGCPASG